MKGTIITEKTMEDSYIFGMFNENKELTKNMLAYIKTGTSLDEGMLEEQFMQIKKSRISPLVDIVMNAFNKGEIEILYSKHAKVPISVPYIVRRDPSFNGNGYGIKASIFISNFGTFNKEMTAFSIPMKSLYVLMESAYIGLFTHTHPSIMEKNLGLMKILCETYTEMFMRILNREYAVSLDQDLHDRVSFIISKFFLESVWGNHNPDIIFNTALGFLKNPNHYDLQDISRQYDEKEIKDISDALLFIKELSPRLSTLSVKYIIQRYMITYNGGAVIAIDYLPYMFYVMSNAVLGGFLMNHTAMSDILKNQKSIRGYYSELYKIMGN